MFIFQMKSRLLDRQYANMLEEVIKRAETSIWVLPFLVVFCVFLVYNDIHQFLKYYNLFVPKEL